MTRDTLYNRLPKELHELADVLHDAASEHFQEPPNYDVHFKLYDDGDYVVKLYQRLPVEEERYDVIRYSADSQQVEYAQQNSGHGRGILSDRRVVATFSAPRRLFDGHDGGDIGRDP